MYTTLEDSRFDKVITLRDAYRVMYAFTREFERRGDLSVSAFTMYAGLLTSGRSADPAALDDFLNASDDLLGHDAEATNS